MRIEHISAAAAALLLAASCGGDAEDPGAAQTSTTPETVAQPSQTTSPEEAIRRTDESSKDGQTPAREKRLGTVTINGQKYRKVRSRPGVVSLLPPRPTTTTALPEHGCRVKRFETPQGGTIRRLMPPAPGLRAERASSTQIVISYWFGEVDPRCRPAYLKFVADVNDDSLSPSGDFVRLRNLRGTVTYDLPESVRAADVVRATVRTSEGLPSNSSAVLID